MNGLRKCGVGIYSRILSSDKKNEILPLVKTQVDLEGIMQINQTEEDRYSMISLICGI